MWEFLYENACLQHKQFHASDLRYQAMQENFRELLTKKLAWRKRELRKSVWAEGEKEEHEWEIQHSESMLAHEEELSKYIKGKK